VDKIINFCIPIRTYCLKKSKCSQLFTGKKCFVVLVFKMEQNVVNSG
jgi:hypothetical protein